MTTRRRDDDPPAGPPEDDPGLLTADDLFGDLVDAPPESPAAPAPVVRKGPIRVQVTEPGAARKLSPFATAGAEDVLPEDVAALLDAFSEPAEAALRAEEAVPPPRLDVPVAAPMAAFSSAPKAPEPLPAPRVEAPTEPFDPLLDALLADAATGEAATVEPANEPREPELPPSVEPTIEPALDAPPEPELTAVDAAPEVTPLEEDVLSLVEEGLEAPPAAAEPTPSAVETEASLQDLINLRRPKVPPDGPSFDDVLAMARPAARTGTKFRAAGPQRSEPQSGGLDLAALAEEALAEPARREPPSPSPAPLEVTLDYGPYRLLERVAVGGMAEIFRAKRTGVEGFEKVVAVKRILSHLSDNKEFVDMFINEAKMVAGLTHPNIVQIFDLGRLENSYFIAMEYVHGRDLRSILRRGKERGLRVPLDISAHVVSKVCAALEYAHRKKDDRGRPMMLVHRDVSPQNILISFEGDVKLTDFGIAKAATKASTTDRGALRGKLLYMSPEQAWGKALDKRSDVFSLGVVFYEMLTEHKPFLGSSEMSILETVRECRVAPPTTLNPRVPEKLERVVMKALERDPELRYQDAGEMLRDLERVLHEWQPATATGLVRFLELLFDEQERGTPAVDEEMHPAEAALGHHTPAGLEVELHEPPPETPPPVPHPGKDPMSIQKLLKRFGIK